MTLQDWGVLFAVFGTLANFVWNLINFFSNRNTRLATARLSDFNTNFRNPLLESLTSLDALVDRADDIARSGQLIATKLSDVAELTKTFHSARRVLARRLNDCDISELVVGADWSRCDEGHMDDATEAFEEAAKAPSEIDLRAKLQKAARAIFALRAELRKKLDAEAKRLMS